ncbi:MAG TPA: hypothetical protein VF317_12885 [Dermatophilaceae bacterium]
MTNRWLGPWTGHPFPIAVTYGSIGISVGVLMAMFAVEAFVGIHGGLPLTIATWLTAVAAGYFIGEKISHDVTGRSVLLTFLAETDGALRADTEGEHAVLRPALVKKVTRP